MEDFDPSVLKHMETIRQDGANVTVEHFDEIMTYVHEEGTKWAVEQLLETAQEVGSPIYPTLQTAYEGMTY